MKSGARPTACVLIIGNEILSGRTQDVNLNYLATQLTDMGVRLAEARVIPDDRHVIIESVNSCRAAYDYVFTTGGIGPTHDDITSECVAAAFRVPLIQNQDARALLETQFKRIGAELNEARLRMANTPKGAVLIDNPVSAAPGYRMGNVFVLAGVPKIMQAMFEGCRRHIAGGPPMLSRTVVAYLPEGTVAAPLGALQAEYDDVEMGSYPFYRAKRFGTSLVLRSTDRTRLDRAVDALIRLVDDLGGDPETE